MEKKMKINLLQEMIKIDSTNGNEKEVSTYLENVFLAHGIKSQQVEYSEGRSSLVTEVGKGDKVLSFSGHMDVVSAGDTSEWTYAPFSGTEANGKIYGRGATDMKSGLAAMVVAMIELAEEKIDLKGRIRLLATVGEEVGLLGAKQLTEEGYAEGLAAMIIGEPTQNHIVYAHKGVFTYTVTSRGVSAHSSMPELGVNAVDKLFVFYQELQESLKKLTVENEALGKFVHNTSIVRGGNQINSVPEKAILTGNCRTIPEFDNQQIEDLLRGLIETINKKDSTSQLSLEINQSSSPMFSDKESRIVQVANHAAKTIIGKEVPVIGISGGTDASEFSKAQQKFPIIIFGPGNATPHQVDECVDSENYLEMIEVYKQIAKDFLSDEQGKL
ncbi:ArgE/DapE family deacylase [Carnobacterium maltaromaticum]|uniref:ArgE/DapE family deacylase n=1 Tax=Carnobacterium maltaromaticum TaxID=2751 RepID=UPI00295E9CC9|nr:ArgE/DapE family deacylase [Carnobacterium maltaromaticum]